MTDTLKVLGQAYPSSGILTDLYVVPAATMTTVSSFSVCNHSNTTGATIRMSIAVGGAADDPSQYIYFDLPMDTNDTFICTIGISLGTGDVVRVQASSNTVSFSIFGVELT
jgi:hypothetical protein